MTGLFSQLVKSNDSFQTNVLGLSTAKNQIDGFIKYDGDTGDAHCSKTNFSNSDLHGIPVDSASAIRGRLLRRSQFFVPQLSPLWMNLHVPGSLFLHRRCIHPEEPR